MSAAKSLDYLVVCSLLLSTFRMFWLGILTISIGSSWCRPSSSRLILAALTAQKMKFFITDFYSKCDQICRKLRIWSHLPKKSVMENFIFCPVFAERLIPFLPGMIDVRCTEQTDRLVKLMEIFGFYTTCYWQTVCHVLLLIYEKRCFSYMWS